jgi:hypothetical protein
MPSTPPKTISIFFIVDLCVLGAGSMISGPNAAETVFVRTRQGEVVGRPLMRFLDSRN